MILIIAQTISMSTYNEDVETTEDMDDTDAPDNIKLQRLEEFETYEIISTDEDMEGSWRLWPLFFMSQTNKTLIWQIGFDSVLEMLIIVRGIYDYDSSEIDRATLSSIHIYRRMVRINTSGRNIYEQALLEARKRFKDMIDDGYNTGRVIANKKKLPPQLCTTYKISTEGKSNYNSFPGDMSPKIDGIRALFWKESTGIIILSRKNKVINFLGHLREEVAKLLEFLPNIGLDCELSYYDKSGKIADYNKIQSVVTRKVNCHPLNGLIVANILDIVIENVTLEDRLDMIDDAYVKYTESYGEPKHILVVPHYSVDDHESIQQMLTQFLVDGYEGGVLRKYAESAKREKESYYLGQRNNNMMKVKTFDERETTVLDVVDAEGEEQGVALLQVKDDYGNVLVVRPRGTFKYRRWMFVNPTKCIGRRYTIIHFGVSETGVPRFPVGKGFRDMM